MLVILVLAIVWQVLGSLKTVRRCQLKYGPSGAGWGRKGYATVPRNKQGSAHPLDSKWQITSYLLFWVSNRIFWGAPSGRCLSRRAWERVDVERVMVPRRPEAGRRLVELA